MRIERDTVRVVVPPLLALAFVAILMHPIDEQSPVPASGVAVTANR